MWSKVPLTGSCHPDAAPQAPQRPPGCPPRTMLNPRGFAALRKNPDRQGCSTPRPKCKLTRKRKLRNLPHSHRGAQRALCPAPLHADARRCRCRCRFNLHLHLKRTPSTSARLSIDSTTLPTHALTHKHFQPATIPFLPPASNPGRLRRQPASAATTQAHDLT